ncbi:unnamed protein product [Linum trigynum]|uniref:Uncharacterized protein n=1 Tax=Linum trigynum TaxID=586398 RepID=A0AAV2EQ21_9ROSI
MICTAEQFYVSRKERRQTHTIPNFSARNQHSNCCFSVALTTFSLCRHRRSSCLIMLSSVFVHSTRTARRVLIDFLGIGGKEEAVPWLCVGGCLGFRLEMEIKGKCVNLV